MKKARIGIVIMIALLCCVTCAYAQEGRLVIDHVEKTDINMLELSISVESNPGIAGLGFYVNYDPAKMEVVNAVTTGIGNGFMMVFNGEKEGQLFVAMVRADNATEDGELMRIRFRLYDEGIVDANGISLQIDHENVCNAALEAVVLSTSQGAAQ